MTTDPLTDTALLDAINRLDASVTLLTGQLTIAKRQARFLRRLSIGFALLVLVAGGGGYYAVKGNHDTQVQSCENANETRAANLQLWTYVLDVAGAGADASDAANLSKIKAWVAILYQPHDCDNLSRVYNVPPPPDLSTAP